MGCIPATFVGVREVVKVMGDVDGLNDKPPDTEEVPTETYAPSILTGNDEAYKFPRFTLMGCIQATFVGVRLAVKVMGDADASK